MSGAQYTITNTDKRYRFDRLSIECNFGCIHGEAMHDQVHGQESKQGFKTQNTAWIQKDQIWTLNKSPTEDSDDPDEQNWILTSTRFPQWNIYKRGDACENAGVVNENRGGENIYNRIVPEGKLFNSTSQ